MRVIRQRTDADCAIAALANLAPGHSYASIRRAGDRVDPKHRGAQGFYNREVLQMAAAVGIMLEPRRAYDLDTEAGVLRLYWKTRDARAKASPHGHFVCVRGGLILDPSDGSALPWRLYVERHGVRLCTLLRIT